MTTATHGPAELDNGFHPSAETLRRTRERFGPMIQSFPLLDARMDDRVLRALRLLLEPAAIVPIAGILSGAFRHDTDMPLAIIASGGNISREVVQAN